jgi:hypothetical protein
MESRLSTQNVPFADDAKMIAVYGQGDGLGKEAGAVAKGPGQGFPEIQAFFAQNSEAEKGFEKRHFVMKGQSAPDLGWAIFPEEGPDPLIVVFG